MNKILTRQYESLPVSLYLDGGVKIFDNRAVNEYGVTVVVHEITISNFHLSLFQQQLNFDVHIEPQLLLSQPTREYISYIFWWFQSDPDTRSENIIV